MVNTPYEGGWGPRLPRNVQLKRLNKVGENELTPVLREILVAYYFQQKTMTQIARERGICTSSVCRTLHRAEDRIRRFFKY